MFDSALCLGKLLLQSFPPIFHLIGGRQSAVFFLSLPPPIIPHSDFIKSGQAITAMITLAFWKSWTTSSLLVVGWGAKSELTGLSINQKASQKELEGVKKNGAAANFAQALRR
jgi:hypothetical protein